MRAIAILPLGACALLAASCGSKKKMAAEPTPAVIPGTEISLETVVSRVNGNRQTERCVTSRVNVSLQAGVKDVSVGGSLRMRRDDCIQLSLVAFGVVEAGRLELTPDYMMLVDRIGHQYVKVAYKDVDFFRRAGIDFSAFQALFWDELFTLGAGGQGDGAPRFASALAGEGEVRLENGDSRLVTLRFLASMLSGLVKQTQVYSKESPSLPVLDWQYLAHDKLGAHVFPSRMKITLPSLKTPVTATLTLSKLKSDDGWETRTKLGTRYKLVPLETVFSRIMSLTL